jgi:hypothetical protein
MDNVHSVVRRPGGAPDPTEPVHPAGLWRLSGVRPPVRYPNQTRFGQVEAIQQGGDLPSGVAPAWMWYHVFARDRYRVLTHSRTI